MNGFGRIGRTCLRAALDRAEEGTQDVEAVAVNDITSPATLASPRLRPGGPQLEYDSTFGRIGRATSNTRRFRDWIVSAASCTTNRVAPMVKVLHEAFGSERGMMTTIHGYTNDQSLLVGPHKDLRRARSAALSSTSTITGTARAVGLVVPELAGALDGVAVRVPVEDGSLTDLAIVLTREASADEINAAFGAAADGPLNGILRVSKAPIVSRDVIGDPSSCIFDPALTQANGTLVNVFGWYDNEWGYTNRLLDLTAPVADD
ncbi:glyceraldehyde 3-phosphate dehydrogenase NAD-binding domain-containing protein [Streptomyces sp. NPDC050263]|uniref:type I glyceraldehyde-3-phosphate dehydrogenase n=1 Tax=Streptomyces sp. NPDC050263 TaxID=3155037 RepID=UPI003418CA63